jgi:LysM repeat protein
MSRNGAFSIGPTCGFGAGARRHAKLGEMRLVARWCCVVAVLSLAFAACSDSGSDSSGDRSSTTIPVSSATTPISGTVPDVSDPVASVATTEPPVCTWTVAAGESLTVIASRLGTGVDSAALREENGLTNPNLVAVGQVLDVCPGNDVDDVTGESRVPVPPSVPAADVAVPTGIAAQQRKVNDLLVSYGMRALDIDGDAGPATRQRLCAVRLLSGLPVSTEPMVPGSDEERILMSIDAIQVPGGTPRTAERWALIDQTCQVMVIGSKADGIAFVFPTSTGSPGYETRPQTAAHAFRFDPALANDGWHDSSEYAVPEDNPLNGNMYKPIYFDDGQAIHGAGNVPPEPRSKGCARLRVENQDQLIAWLGLDVLDEMVWSARRINLVVTVQGMFVPDPVTGGTADGSG